MDSQQRIRYTKCSFTKTVDPTKMPRTISALISTLCVVTALMLAPLSAAARPDMVTVRPAPNVVVALPAMTGSFARCAETFAHGNLPTFPGIETLAARALCFDGFAVLHSGVTKTPLYVAEVLNRARLEAARGEQRTDVFFADARLPARERATLGDYRGSGYDRGHMAPAANMASPEGMAQSFSLANIVPQAPENNRGAWAEIETATRRYISRAQGDVFVITGPVFSGPAKTIGAGVRVPSHLFKLVYDPSTRRAWAHWTENTNDARIGRPISYQELVSRTGVDWLPGVNPLQ